MQSNHLVFVRCFTYNHEPYIEDALNGFAMQQTNFPFVVTVVDDASTDNNVSVISNWISDNCVVNDNYYAEEKEYGKVIHAQARNNPNCIFNVILLKENHYHKKSKRPYYAQLEESAKYVAICEGDDYWTVPLKLQKQVDFLETHPEYTMCCHGVDWYQDGKFYKRNEISQTDVDLRIEDIISQGGFYINYCSLVFRKEYMQFRTRYQQIADYGDHPLYVKLALAGKVRYLHDVMGVYRWMNNNSWTNRNYHDNHKLAVHFYNTVEWLLALNEETNGKYKSTIAAFITPLISTAYLYGAYPSEWRYLQDVRFVGKRAFKRTCKNLLIRHFPHTYELFMKITGKPKRE